VESPAGGDGAPPGGDVGRVLTGAGYGEQRRGGAGYLRIIIRSRVPERPDHEELTEADDPAGHADAPFDLFDLDDEDGSAVPVHSWLGAIGQMIAALLVVVALVALFIGAAVAFRRLLP
jgi:hypothetical protein